jgi:hypothetical protein
MVVVFYTLEFMPYQQKTSPRAEYRRQEAQQTNVSATLAEQYKDMKSLTVDLEHYSPGGLNQTGAIKCTLNLLHAKSRLRFDCPNGECVGGDFDLTKALADAVAARRTTASGELVCQGWRNKTTIDREPCHTVLRYKLSVRY